MKRARSETSLVYLKMRSFFLLSLLTFAVEKVSSQAGAWEKCKFTKSPSGRVY